MNVFLYPIYMFFVCTDIAGHKAPIVLERGVFFLECRFY